MSKSTTAIEWDSPSSPPSSEGEGEEPSPSPSLSLSSSSPRSSFQRDRHVTFLQMMYQMLPYHYQTQEINRLTLAYFVVSGLDILGALDSVDKNAVADWVLSLQACPVDGENSGVSMVPELLSFQ
uniref:Prenyltransferase alpha-alpha toroid domain-containing protein n=1 Tax=Rhizophora mucronata TaxID=61149 RepID=A0A2P2LGI2_RHIMU